MKYLLMLLLFSSSGIQTVIYNTPTSQYYVIDPTSDPIQILILEENTRASVACISNQEYMLSEVDFSNNSECLMTTLNQEYGLSIQKYADLKDTYSLEALKHLKSADLPSLLNAVLNISHSYSIPELYDLYKNVNKNEFRYEIHHLTYFKIGEEYLPVSYPL